MFESNQIQVFQELLALAEKTIRSTSPTEAMAEQRMARLKREITENFPDDAVAILEKRHYKQRQNP